MCVCGVESVLEVNEEEGRSGSRFGERLSGCALHRSPSHRAKGRHSPKSASAAPISLKQRVGPPLQASSTLLCLPTEPSAGHPAPRDRPVRRQGPRPLGQIGPSRVPPGRRGVAQRSGRGEGGRSRGRRVRDLAKRRVQIRARWRDQGPVGLGSRLGTLKRRVQGPSKGGVRGERALQGAAAISGAITGSLVGSSP